MHLVFPWFSRCIGQRHKRDHSSQCKPILIVLEGSHDCQFLKQISSILHRSDSSLPDLRQWEAEGRCVFIPAGGGDATAWTLRLSALRLPQFHLFDRETHGVSYRRGGHVRLLNLLPHCRATLTSKRSLENYLHPQAIAAALGVEAAIDDDTNVAEVVAQLIYRSTGALPWAALPLRSRKRRRERVKHALNEVAVSQMTAGWLTERDPAGEVRGWLETLRELASLA